MNCRPVEDPYRLVLTTTAPYSAGDGTLHPSFQVAPPKGKSFVLGLCDRNRRPLLEYLKHSQTESKIPIHLNKDIRIITQKEVYLAVIQHNYQLNCVCNTATRC